MEAAVEYTTTSSSSSSSRFVGVLPVSRQLPNDLRKLALAYLYMVVVSFIESCMAVVSNIRLPDPKHYPPLDDVVFETLPFMPWAFRWAEIITLLMGVVLALVFVFHKHR